MTAVTSLELVFDDASDAAVRREWDALVAADLPSQARHTGASNRPHITLLVRHGPVEIASAELDASLPLPLTLGAPVLFGTGRTRVLARSVVPSMPLLRLHERAHALAGAASDADHTRPGAWTAHVTLARRVPLDRIAEALAAVETDGPGERHMEAVGIRRWDAEAKTISTIAGRGTLGTC